MVNSKKKIVKILENKKVSVGYFKLSFVSPWPAAAVTPGQFIEVKIGDGIRPFLRKPLGIHRVTSHQPPVAGQIEILYEVVGEGTRQLSEKKSGAFLDIIGPLGNGFDYGSPVAGRQSPVLIAGGIGVAPLMALAERLVHGPRSMVNGKKIYVLIGAKTKGAILCEKEFKKLGCEIKIATDDGSKGHKGFVTELLKSLLSTIDHGPLTIYACGPKPMLKEAAKIAEVNKINCQVLLEEYMACGVGVCLGCAVKVKTGHGLRGTGYEYKMVCKDGPVFEASDIIWD